MEVLEVRSGKEKCVVSNISKTWFLYGSLFITKAHEPASHGRCVSACD